MNLRLKVLSKKLLKIIKNLQYLTLQELQFVSHSCQGDSVFLLSIFVLQPKFGQLCRRILGERLKSPLDSEANYLKKHLASVYFDILQSIISR